MAHSYAGRNHLTSGKKAGEKKLWRTGKGMTSVNQNNDTTLKSTCSHIVIGEGLIQSLKQLNQQMKYSLGPGSKSANDTVRSA